MFKFKVGSGKPETTKNINSLSKKNDIISHSPLGMDTIGNRISTSSGSTPSKVNYDKLWWAVGIAESSNGTGHPCGTAWHKAANNCVSIMSWTGGKRHLKKFPSIEVNKAAFKALWTSRYGDELPQMKQAIIYTGNEKSSVWLETVLSSYNSQK